MPILDAQMVRAHCLHRDVFVARDPEFVLGVSVHALYPAFSLPLPSDNSSSPAEGGRHVCVFVRVCAHVCVYVRVCVCVCVRMCVCVL
jgi:hypothetical protein